MRLKPSEVADRIAAAPGATRVPTPQMELFVVPDVLDEAIRAALIERIDAGKRPSRVMSEAIEADFRTSESCDLNPNDPLVRKVEARLAAVTGLDPLFGESIQGQRYGVGQQFKGHHDFFNLNEPYWEFQNASGGQRTWTAMAFLNVPEEGGHTNFPHVKVKIRPRAGSLLLWNNLNKAGEINSYTLHEGQPVIAGVKYVITKWYRERLWKPPWEQPQPDGAEAC